MKIKFDQPILSYNGKPIYTPMSQERVGAAMALLDPDTRAAVEAAFVKVGMEPLTYAETCASAMVGNAEKVALKGKSSIARLRLAERICAGGEVEINPDERDDIKAMVEAAHRDAIVPGRVFQLLERE